MVNRFVTNILGQIIEIQVPTILPTLQLTQAKAYIRLDFMPGEQHDITMDFSQDLTKVLAEPKTYTYDLKQYNCDNNNDVIIGGENYIIPNFVQNLSANLSLSQNPINFINPTDALNIDLEEKANSLYSASTTANNLFDLVIDEEAESLKLNFLEKPTDKFYNLSIYDMSGKEVYNSKVEVNHKVKVNFLSKGLYTAVILDGNGNAKQSLFYKN